MKEIIIAQNPKIDLIICIVFFVLSAISHLKGNRYVRMDFPTFYIKAYVRYEGRKNADNNTWTVGFVQGVAEMSEYNSYHRKGM